MRERAFGYAVYAVVFGYSVSLALANGALNPTGVGVNKSVPKVEPPKTKLAFSANPTVQEIFRAHVFEEPLVPVGGEPSASDNAALTAALLDYSKRSGPDDFSGLTGFLKSHPKSPWCAALLTDLGLEYYNTAHYSLAFGAWSNAWTLAKDATELKAHALADRAFGEWIYMDARLGRMDEIDALLKSINNRVMMGPAAERVVNAREALWNMKNHPEISFRCGPLALRSILAAIGKSGFGDAEILKSASTQKGCSLPQVAELSRKVGLNYQMAFREKGGDFIVPSVVHWQVGHYAALVRKVGDLYQLQDPTFGNSTWATKDALEAETTGYFLIPPGPLPAHWRSVGEKEGATVWGKGLTSGNDDRNITKNDLDTSDVSCVGMAVPSIDLMTANLSLSDEPLGYRPPVGPAVRLRVRYNHRESFQPANFNYSNFGPQWTCDWISCITDNPSNLLADVNLYPPGGGERTFTDFNTNTQTFAYQQYDQTLLTRTGPNSYELLSGDGSKLVFNQPDGSIGTSRKVFLTQIVDPQGNAVTLTYDQYLRIVAVTDAIGQVTTLTYGVTPELPYSATNTTDIYKITKVTDPFGRSATFNYVPFKYLETINIVNGQPQITSSLYEWVMGSVTDVVDMPSQVTYVGNLVQDYFPTSAEEVRIYSPLTYSLITPYGTNYFYSADSGNTRVVEVTYADGSKERVEYTQTNNVPQSDPAPSVPVGMSTHNAYLRFRNTYYWDRTACALAYGDYSKARLYHWLHTENLATTAGALESMKPPLGGRIWFDYAGQGDSIIISPSTRPTHVGRVLDDGSTQLYTFGYNAFGHLTSSVDPVGRRFSLTYATNGIDLLEVRQTRGGNNELIFKATYNSQHRPLTTTDAAGQTTTYTYNARGQVLTKTDPKHETITYTYDADGYLTSIDGRLPGTNDTASFTYDPEGRVRTITDVNGYTLTFDYDDLNRLTRITHPDGTFSQYTYDRLDLAAVRDRAGRQTFYDYDNMRQLVKLTDPLGRVTRFDWCQCGALGSVTDPMGRTTSWLTDVQGRRIAKQYADGSQVRYLYDQTSSRLQQVIDEKQQSILYAYNLDNTLKSISFGNATIPTPPISYQYDPNYRRVVSATDGIGTTRYNYYPITTPPTLGAGKLASMDGPLTNDTVTFNYDELGRQVGATINSTVRSQAYDAAGRIISQNNELGSFSYSYDGSSHRIASETFPNGILETATYGDNLHDRVLQQISYATGATPISQFDYGTDIPARRITTWAQQAGNQPSSVFTFGYDAVNQLFSAVVTNSGAQVNVYSYSYDPAGNRLAEQAGMSNSATTYNALNQISTATAMGASRTNEWDAVGRLVAVNAGNQRTEFSYDTVGRVVGIRELINGTEVSRRELIWCGLALCEERDGSGAVTKRFFPQGMKVVSGPNAGNYFYTRDHLGSIRELTDESGTVRARYAYDPYGRRTKVSGDVEADFGFAGMFWSAEVNLALTHFRTYDPQLGRWLSRDPLRNAEIIEGPNLYAYAGNNPINVTDRSGLASGPFWGPNWWSLPNNWTEEEVAQWQALMGLEGKGEIVEVFESELLETPDLWAATEEAPELVLEATQVEQQTATRFYRTIGFPRQLELPRIPAGLSDAYFQVVGAGITILTMTDCNTVNGILGLVRQGKGGLLNIYEDQQMKQLEQMQ